MTTTELADDTDRILHIDPTELRIFANVRQDVKLDPEFCASVKDRGVLETITCKRDDDGGLSVLRGQRRTLAAVKAKLPTVPVRVVTDPDEIDRITDQLVENVHREAMTAADEIAAVEQLALLGVSAAQIQKRTHLGKDTVQKALRVSKSEVAKEVAKSHALTIDQAAVVDEFADEPEVVAKLTAAAPTGQFDHVAEIAREERADREMVDARVAELRAAGVANVCKEAPAYESGARQVYGFEGWSHGDSPEEAEEKHRTCPGHLVYVGIQLSWDAEARERVKRVKLVPYCTDFKANGHKEHAAYGTATQEKTDADREAEAAERKRVIANNKLWKAATTVRRAFIRQELMQRKSLPDVERFVYFEMLHSNTYLEEALSGYHGFRKYRDAMGLETERPQDKFSCLGTIDEQLATLRAGAEHWTPKKLAVHTAALVLCAWEEKTEERQVWRNPNDVDARMLRQLAAWGYQLAEIEQDTIDAVDKARQDAEDKAREAHGADLAEELADEPIYDGDPDEDDADDEDDDAPDVDLSGLDEFKPAPADEKPDEVGAIVIGGVVVARVEHHDLTADDEDPDEWEDEEDAEHDPELEAEDDPMDDIA
jgi:ParB family chromosome partitioning protein